MWDVEGKRYIDLVQSYGAIILGHAHPKVVEAVRQAAADGTSYRRADGARGAAGRGDLRAGAELREGAHGQQRHRGDHDRASASRAASPAGEGREVRRQLPRPRRRAARRRAAAASRRSGSRARPACRNRRVARDDRGRRTTWCPISTTTSRASSSSRSPPTWAWSRRSPGFLEGLREACDAAGALLVFDEVITGFRLGARRRAAALRRHARPHVLRQGHRRRASRRRVRRPGRRDGRARAARPRVPSRHAVGESRSLRPRASQCSTSSTTAST